MKHTMPVIVLLITAATAAAQTKDPTQILAATRQAMGGEKVSDLRTLTAKGRNLRTGPDGNTRETEFELSLAMPDKYVQRSVLAAMGNMSVYRLTGFNGSLPIEEVDQPPNLQGGMVVIRMAGPGGNALDVAKMTPEQKAEFLKQQLSSVQREFARLALGLFGNSTPAYPLTFAYAGEAESDDGKADVLDVAGPDGFAVKFFVDQATHLPLMISWMDKEPVRVTMNTGAAGTTTSAGGATVTQSFSSSGQPPSKDELEKRMKELEARRKELEATRRTVEFRIFYGDYQTVGGVRLPHRIQRSIDGKPTEEMVFDTFKVNPKIDVKTFEPSK